MSQNILEEIILPIKQLGEDSEVVTIHFFRQPMTAFPIEVQCDLCQSIDHRHMNISFSNILRRGFRYLGEKPGTLEYNFI